MYLPCINISVEPAFSITVQKNSVPSLYPCFTVVSVPSGHPDQAAVRVIFGNGFQSCHS